jgi:hypothetical protein
VPIHIQIGLNSGEVVVRSIGSDLHMDYTAVGQTTHLAARMEQMAMPGSNLITPAVLGLAEGYVQVTPLGPMPVRGPDAPVEVFDLVGASGIHRRLRAVAARGFTRFVDRAMELATLAQALEHARAGHGQVVAVIGEAGMGKSRLVYEFLHSHHTPGWLVLERASVSYGKATPYLPVIDLLKRYCHTEDSDHLRTIRARARHAPAPGPLPPRPRHLVCPARPAGAGPYRTLRGHRVVPRHGHDFLAARGGGGTGASGGAQVEAR